MSNAGVKLPGRMFRTLTADEIDVRIGVQSVKGCSLLLYKDARCDQNILDETVTPLGWKREHTRNNANCIVSIWNEATGQWVSKEDTGSESNTEKEKGLASDSFKRACVNWGIGRELYTSPFVFIKNELLEFNDKKKNAKGLSEITTKFNVSEIDYDEKGNIVLLEIVSSKGKVLYRHNGVRKPSERPAGSPSDEMDDNAPAAPQKVSEAQKAARRAVVDHIKEMLGIDDKGFIELYNKLVSDGVLPAIAIANMSNVQFDAMVKAFQANFDPA